MTIDLGERGIRLVLLDIEGTTTPISFVHDELFPFARERLGAHLASAWHDADTQAAVRHLQAEHAAEDDGAPAMPSDASAAQVATYARWLMDRDRKSTGLKLLQGHIWQAGFAAGVLHGQVYADVPPAMARWRAAGRRVAIYSSGSEQAQRLLFSATDYGDLTPHLSGFFDTRVGPKVASASYRAIVETLGLEAGHVLFVSDVVAELAAARDAGVAGVLSLRPGNPTQDGADEFDTIRTFDELV